MKINNTYVVADIAIIPVWGSSEEAADVPGNEWSAT